MNCPLVQPGRLFTIWGILVEIVRVDEDMIVFQEIGKTKRMGIPMKCIRELHPVEERK